MHAAMGAPRAARRRKIQCSIVGKGPVESTKTTRAQSMDTARPNLIAAALAGALAVVGFSLPVLAAEQTDTGQADQATLEKAFPAKPAYSPYVGRNFPTRPLFGDTHLHTSFSMDASAFGARLTPRDAYRFARA